MKGWHPTSWDEYFSSDDEDRMSLEAQEPGTCGLCGHDLFPFFDGTGDRCSWCGAETERPLRIVEDAS